MKKRIQKYLSGSNEGFSLVELIIVIAIMAILVGVVALAVIPNLERSRESKDLSTLDSACSALSVAVANAGNKAGDGSITIDCQGGAAQTSDSAEVLKAFNEQIDATTLKLGSSAAGSNGITLTWATENGANTVKAEVTGAGDLQYATNDGGGKGNEKKLIVIGSKKVPTNQAPANPAP